MPDQSETTQLLRQVRTGNREVFDRLFAQVYDELRVIAHRRLRQFRPGETLDTTGLVHEAYLKLVDQTGAESAHRTHFMALASRAMRFIVVDHARSRSRQKRGAGAAPVSLDTIQLAAKQRATEVLAHDEALEARAHTTERLCRLVEYRFFGGLSYDEIAEVTGRSVPTVKRDWSLARAWLHRTMQTAEG
jgi:RNA polymerase sigma factor (TIGR02999 family)